METILHLPWQVGSLTLHQKGNLLDKLIELTSDNTFLLLLKNDLSDALFTSMSAKLMRAHGFIVDYSNNVFVVLSHTKSNIEDTDSTHSDLSNDMSEEVWFQQQRHMHHDEMSILDNQNLDYAHQLD